ncbi:hypothetical protein T484DRAFT_1758279, partial [Baffinella frigidus]
RHTCHHCDYDLCDTCYRLLPTATQRLQKAEDLYTLMLQMTRHERSPYPWLDRNASFDKLMRGLPEMAHIFEAESEGCVYFVPSQVGAKRGSKYSKCTFADGPNPKGSKNLPGDEQWIKWQKDVRNWITKNTGVVGA